MTLSRRTLLQSSAVASAVAAAALAVPSDANAKSWAAKPPAGFLRRSIPGKVVKVHKAGCLDANGLYPSFEDAAAMLERALTELTGKATLKEALGEFIHPEDIVAIKPNGIAGRETMKMAANKEYVVALVKGLIDLGVPAANITIFEQYRDFLFATRCITDKQALTPAPEFPAGVKMKVHLNSDAVMEAIDVNGIATKYVTPFTEATAVINVTQIKDHGICGFTGALKNITHGCNINPSSFHDHNAAPQIAHLYSQQVVKSRVALHISDASQVIFDKGPIDKSPRTRVKHEALYASTDPVALDVVGWRVVEEFRKEKGLPTLKAAGREPTYIEVASQLGLGVFDDTKIRLREIEL
jgi:uncharacterized protein (DUF362 family)